MNTDTEYMTDAEFLQALEIAWPYYEQDYVSDYRYNYICLSLIEAAHDEKLDIHTLMEARDRISEIICGACSLHTYLRDQCGMKDVTAKTCYIWWKTYIADLRKRVEAQAEGER